MTNRLIFIKLLTYCFFYLKGGLKRVAWPPEEYTSPTRVIPQPQHRQSPAVATVAAAVQSPQVSYTYIYKHQNRMGKTSESCVDMVPNFPTWSFFFLFPTKEFIKRYIKYIVEK